MKQIEIPFKPLYWYRRLLCKRDKKLHLGQNIWRLFHFLAQFLFTTSETELDFYHQTISARVTLRTAERLPHGIFAAGGAYVPTQEKTYDLRDIFHTKTIIVFI